MLNLDVPTLIVAALFIYFLVAGLILVAALQGSQSRVLWWMAAALLIGGTGVLIGLAGSGVNPGLPSIWLASTLPLTSHACMWAGMRRFSGRRVLWPWLLAGAVVWTALCFWPGFVGSVAFRVLAYSLLVLGYTGAAVAELWPEWRRHSGAVAPVLFFLVVHMLFNCYRMVPRPSMGGSWADRTDLISTLLESMFFVTGLAFSTLAMVRTRTERHYQHASLHDELTGLPNRRALFDWGHRMLAHADDKGDNVAALMCDLDWFKEVNDKFGHEAGDEVLKVFAQVLRESVRAEDLYARLGGEEFVILMPNPGSQGADELADRIRRNLADKASELPCTQSVSVGIAWRDEGHFQLDRLLTRADQALYAAKADGRDRVRVWPVELPDDGTSTTTRSRYRPPVTPSLGI